MAYAYEWGKKSKCHLKRKKLKKMGKWTEGTWTTGAGLTPSRGNIYVYHNNIQRSSSLYEAVEKL